VSKTLLSICIPVYNFGAFIGETLESIISQASHKIEIVIVDGASTDNTEEIINRYQTQYPGLRYYRLERRGGIDRDMSKSVELANGEFCWLFGGDDIMMQGALPRVLSKLSSASDLYLCESMLCDFNLRPFAKHNLLNINTEKTFDLGVDENRLQYFKEALNTAAFFSFCGALIFKKSAWDSVELNESFVGSCWAHAARFFELIPRGLIVTYLPEPCIYKRGDNDSFRDRGIVHRLKIAIDGYNRLANTYFGKDSKEAFHIRRALINDFSLFFLFQVKSECSKKKLLDDMLLLDGLVQILYSDPLLKNRIYLSIYLFTPLSVYQSLSFLWRRVRPLILKMKGLTNGF
jgi:O-antigen biosynthesis alpha-1,3-abequosyltransferase